MPGYSNSNYSGKKEAANHLIKEGQRLLRENSYREALNIFEHAKVLDERDSRIYVGRGDCLYGLRKYKEALEAYDRAIICDKKRARAYIGRGKILYLLYDYNNACEAFEMAISYAQEPTYISSRVDGYRELCLVYISLKNYEKALDAYEDMKKLNQKRDVRLDRIPLKLRADRMEKHVWEGNRLLERHDYESALAHFQSALYFELANEGKKNFSGPETNHQSIDTNLCHAYVGKGHAEFALQRSGDALKSYTEAVDLGTKDILSFLRIGDLLSEQQHYDDALHYYDIASRLQPNDFATETRIAKVYFDRGDHETSLQAYQKALNIFNHKKTNGETVSSKKHLELLLMIGDLYTFLGKKDEAFAAYEKSLVLIDTTDMCLLAWNLPCLSRPASVWLALCKLLCKYIVNNNSYNTQMEQILEKLSDMYSDLFDPLYVVKEDMDAHIIVLQEIFMLLPVKRREEALRIIARHDERQVAHLLICLAPVNLSGLTMLVQNVMEAWHKLVFSKDLVYQFYRILPGYAIAQEQADLFLARCLLDWREYKQVQVVLTPHIQKSRPQPDSLWYTSLALQQLEQDPEQQVPLLRRFSALFSDDTRVVDAYKRIGDLCWEHVHDGPGALAAYREAAKRGVTIPRLNLFRLGNWENEILHALPDYSFPPMVVIDIESEYDPDAALGSQVFEVAAVRVKGNTELDVYQAVIQREFVAAKVAERQDEAKPQEIVTRELQAFIDATSTPQRPTIIVGHNLRSFDARHLRAMGINIREEQIIDTLELARLLYPDSLHHHLALLCDVHGIVTQGKYHHALPDAQACGRLLHVLGDEFIRRGARLLNGVRALVPPGSAFDRTILQPRRVPADPTIAWKLDPAPALPAVLAYAGNPTASPAMMEALQSKNNLFVECNDFYGTYIQHLPAHLKAVVTVGTRARLERMLSSASSLDDIFVLPNTRTLLCPSRLRQSIEKEADTRRKLTLFCLYQASHNHDAQTLYPLRLPSSEEEFKQLRQALLASCCSSEMMHTSTCPALRVAEKAAEECYLLLATHETFLHQTRQPQGDLIVIDDINKLQMHFVSHLAAQLNSVQVQQWSDEVFHLLDQAIDDYVADAGEHSVAHERIHLRYLAPYLRMPRESQKTCLLARLKELGAVGRNVAQTVEELCNQAEQEAMPRFMHAYWLDIWFSHQARADKDIERWQFNGLHCHVHDEFRARFWSPYTQHILCGTAVSLGKEKTRFLESFFGLHQGQDIQATLLVDALPPRKMYIPRSADEYKPGTVQLRPASFLGRRSWAESVGMFLYHLAVQPTAFPFSTPGQQSLMITLHETAIADALACTMDKVFSSAQTPMKYRVLSPSLGWTTAKIAERLVAPMQPTIAFVSPFARETSLDMKVNIEATGPMRFLNQRDPLVAAHICMFSNANSGIPMADYLLPQAMLELKTRLSSSADVHIILDSGLRSKIYWDEIEKLFENDEIIHPDMQLDESETKKSFADILSTQLKQHGFSSQRAISPEELRRVLYTVWELKEFRKSPLDQETIIQEVLAGNDQLVIAATGGGKSLCFQVPAILLAQESLPLVTLVISPLIALMTNQVEALRKKGIFSAIVLNSTLSSEQRQSYLRGISQGDYSIIYAAPEQIRSSQFRRALTNREIGLIAFDEAHCVSQWGHNFRTDYLAIKEWIEANICSNAHRSFPLLALTATARKGHSSANYHEQSTILDIIKQLGLQKDGKLLSEDDVQPVSPERPELLFKVIPVTVLCPKCEKAYLTEPPDATPVCPSCGVLPFSRKKEDGTYVFSECVKESKLKQLISLLDEEGEQGLRQRWGQQDKHMRQRGLIYCAHRKTTQQVAAALKNHPALGGLKVAYYHGDDMSTKIRNDVYQRFMRNELDIVVATNAFGMGIDVERLGFVIHFDVPGTLENYYQEAGRAGRDPSFKDGKQKADCILLYHKDDLRKQRYLNEMNRITEQGMERVYDVLNRLRTGGESELVISVAVLALLAHVEDKQVKTILYYLERNTHINDKSVLARGENAGNNKRQLRFERGYQQRLSEQSLELLRVFQSPEAQGVPSAFRLNELYTTVINIDELATELQQNSHVVREKIGNLLKRHILVEASYSYMQWHKNQKDALEAVNNFINDIQIFLRGIERQDVYSQTHLWRKRTIPVNVDALHKQYALKTPVDIFLNLIDRLAKVDAKKLQLFSHFQRASKSPIRGMYELSLKPTTLIDAENIYQLMHTYLRMTIEKLALKVLPSNDEEKDTWHVVDKLNEVPDYSVDLSVPQRDRQRMEEYEKRALLANMLLMLDQLKILTLHKDQDEYQEMLHIIFKQIDVTAEAMRDTIDIDLSKFRQVEYYNECKLEAMQAYAEISDGKYAQRFNDYFLGITPLIIPFEICPELTEEQRAIVTLTEGYHRIDGPAGSGKTLVLEEHLEYLVESMLVPPERILVATHFNSAKDRIAHNSKGLRRKKDIQIRTLNGFGDDIFKQYRALLIQSDGQPYYAEGAKLCLMNEHEAKQYALLREAKSLLFQENTILASWPADLPSVRDFNRIDFQEIINDKGCLNFINRLREYGVFPVLYESVQAILDAAKSSSLPEQKMAIYYALYRAYLRVRARQGIYTYDDQILFALAILNANPQLARRYQRSFEHIIVDEYQDFTSVQARLLLLLSKRHQHLMLFGDERQDIRPDKITSGVSLLYNAQRHYFTTNFRCVQGILTLAHAVLKDKSQPVQKTKSEQRDKKPGIIYVERRPSPASHDKSRQEDEEYTNLLKVMVDAALDCMSTLPSRDRKGIGFIVAKTKYLNSVKVYIENEKKEYLKRKRIKYRIMKNEYSYQSSYMNHMLTYFRLICDGMQEKDVEDLLRYCLTIPFEKNRVQVLKELAQGNKMTLCAFLKDQSLRNSWCDDPEQAEILHKHLSLLERFGPADNASQLWEAISELPAGPMELQKMQQKEEIKQDGQATEDALNMRQELEGKTVQEFLDHARSHISFLPTNSSDDDWVDLVLTTIDYAKSQEFTTVFLLGADQLKDKNRWYVAVTRARNRFFCLVDKIFDQNGSMIPAIRPYCTERTWPELESELYASYQYTPL